MKTALENLKKEICSLPKKSEISSEQYKNFVDNCVVALMTGGESSRFKEVEGANDTHKNSFKLPNNDTMLEMTIRMYKDAGIKNFAALVYYEADTIKDLLGDGSKMGIHISYSYDPGHPVGKGGAIKNAIVNGAIPNNKNLIVHNPDDVIINYKGSFPKDIIAGHIQGTLEGNIATVVIVEETPYAFTGMKINKGQVSQIEMYPMVPIPTHIGVTIFSPESFELFDKLFDLNKKSDFEKILFPILSEEKKLYATTIPNNCWLAVNNLKTYRELVNYLITESSNFTDSSKV
ncbi:MAG: sugar phosphate nucleotidyltransferase [bacterium]